MIVLARIPVQASEDTAGLEHTLGNLPLYFIENQGQVDCGDVAFYVKGADKTLYFTSEGITFALQGNCGYETERWTVKLRFAGANRTAPVGRDQQQAVFSYFKGKPEDWKTGLPTYTRLVYQDLWPGIDLVYSGTVNRLKYEFIVAPGADPGLIRLEYEGATEVTMDASGRLSVTTPVAGFLDGVPLAYQLLDGERRDVAMSYALRDGADNGSFSYGFDIGDYDPAALLILDPDMLIYCGYVGGNGQGGDGGGDIVIDSQGCAYLTGTTNSDENTFPVVIGPDLTYNGPYWPTGDAFVAKVNARGTGLDYCGYIGGASDDSGDSIAVDGQGNAYVTGRTRSDETSFPVLGGPDLTFNGHIDAYIAKVNAQGTGLDFCGYIGGDQKEHGYGIAVDDQGNAHIAGHTASDESTFPVTVGPDLTFNGNGDVFVAKVNSQGTALDYCGYIGGSDGDNCSGLAVDSQGNAYVTGDTKSDESTFPVTVGPDLSFNGNVDAFVAKLNAQGMSLAYCGYIGGGGEDYAWGKIAVDGLGSAYVAGATTSGASTFPVKVGPYLTYNGSRDAFVAKVNVQGTGIDYCGYIGGLGMDAAWGIAVDGQGNAFVCGQVANDDTDFPKTVGPYLTHSGYGDVFVAMVNPQGTGLLYCGFIGGDDADNGKGIAVDGLGNAYIVGTTSSYQMTFPVVVGPDLTYNGSGDAFVAKVPPFHVLLRAGNVATATEEPADVLLVNGSAGDDCYRTIVNPAGTPVTVAMQAPPGGPNPGAFALYAWPGEAGAADVAKQPYDIGTACFPMPLGNGTPAPPPITLVNNIGYPFMLGIPRLPGIPKAPAYIVQNKTLSPGTWTLQGIIFDTSSASGTASLTNAIVVVQQ